MQSRGNSVLNVEYISRDVLHLLDSVERIVKKERDRKQMTDVDGRCIVPSDGKRK